MRIVPAILLALFLVACAGPARRVDAPAASAAPAADQAIPEKSPAPPPLAEPAPADYARPCATIEKGPRETFECDRKSILAMAGEFRVRFAFEESAALAPGYAPHAAQRSGGTELVLVVDDDGNHISLQHILVLGDKHTVVKHWRQDWQYQPRQILRFRGNGRFEIEPLDARSARGAWSQTVYEVDDAPRYAGIGHWTHDHGVDAWQSDRTWRPLPRREYTKRDDYQALEVVNRHTLTPAGWVHEQDNTKLAIDGSGNVHALARETGLNSYTRLNSKRISNGRSADYDFTAGRDYWRKTETYWREVRGEWARFERAHPRFVTSPEPNGEPRIEKFFDLAKRAETGATIDRGEIAALLDDYVKADPVPRKRHRAPRRSPSSVDESANG